MEHKQRQRQRQPTGESSSPSRGGGGAHRRLIPPRRPPRQNRLDFVEEAMVDETFGEQHHDDDERDVDDECAPMIGGGGAVGAGGGPYYPPPPQHRQQHQPPPPPSWRSRCLLVLGGSALVYVGAVMGRSSRPAGRLPPLPPPPSPPNGRGRGRGEDGPGPAAAGGRPGVGDGGSSGGGGGHRPGSGGPSSAPPGPDGHRADQPHRPNPNELPSPSSPSSSSYTSYRVSQSVHDEFVRWSDDLHESTEMSAYSGGEPSVNWDWHPRDRSDRFPSVRTRIEYYMGRWYNATGTGTAGGGGAAGGGGGGGGRNGSEEASIAAPVRMYGPEYRRATYAAHRTTRKFGIMSSFAVDLFDMKRDALTKCDATEQSVLHAYCRDYVDLAILHGGCTTSVIQHLGDSIPASYHKDVRVSDYPVWNKVRHFCRPLHRDQAGPDLNPECRRPDRIETIVWPMNRHRHLTPAAHVSESDVPWSQKRPRAIWRGGSNDPFGMTTKFDLVRRHVNSTLVDAKFAKRSNKRGRGKTKDIPPEYMGPFIDQEEQLRNRYLISIEGNDVSSGLKWMLFSNSVVLLPPTTYESWAMEGLLEPFVHYIPIKSDASDVEERVRWAESNPQQAQRIAERSTLFVYDLLFHPDALKDEQSVLEGMVERYESNFGYGPGGGTGGGEVLLHPLDHLHPEWHPERRADRFPSVEERTRVCLGRWAKRDVPMGRDDADHPLHGILESKSVPNLNSEFVASGAELTRCTRGEGDGRYSDRRLGEMCRTALPYFDERLTYDLKGDRHPKEDEDEFRLAPEGEDRKQNRWFKRILIDDAIKVLRFADGPTEVTNYPVFAGCRDGGSKKGAGASILWRFDYEGEYGLVESGLVERLDVPFGSKRPGAVWRGGFGTSSPPVGVDGAEFERRVGLVNKSLSTSAKKIDAKFVLSKEETRHNKELGKEGLAPEMILPEPEGQGEREEYLKSMLSFRYIVATEDDFRNNSDLKWMLLSQSVVLMPKKLRFTTWFMESHLEPHVHFVPVKDDYSDVEYQIGWCEDAPEACEKISERATLFVHDMLFDRSSEKDSAEVQFRIMERYSDHFGS